MKKSGIIFALFLYVCAAFSLFYYIFLELDVYYLITLTERFFYVFLTCILIYGGSIVLVKNQSDNKIKIMKNTFRIFFGLYVVLLVTITLFDPLLRSGVTRIVFDSKAIIAYFKSTASLRPFWMMALYWNGLNRGLLSISEYLMNMVGNFIAMMPLALFLPMLSRTFKRPLPFVVTVTLIILTIESLQAITMSGYFDVDDIILNLSGALAMFYILRTPFINEFILRLSFGSISVTKEPVDD